VKNILALILLFLSPLVRGESPVLILDDFENEQPWETKEWGDGANLSLETQNATHGKRSLRVRFDKAGGVPHPKGIVIRRSLLGRAVDFQDFTFDIYVEASAPLRLKIGLDADQTYERPPILLQPGWNRNVQLQILSGKFQAWDSELGKVVMKPELAIGSLILSFHRELNEAGSVYMDNIRTQHRPEWNLNRPQAPKPDQHVVRIKSVGQPERTLKIYQPLELTVDLDALVLDPYDPNEFELKGLFTSPQGSELEIPGFLHSGEVSGTEPVRNAVWKIRFTPTQAGDWTYRVVAKNRWQRVQSESVTQHVEFEMRDGFVRVDPKFPQYFTFDSGRFYYPIGQNVAWLPFRDYDRYFYKMSQHGENWARIWMTNWSFGIEWKPMGQFQGLGAYNLDRAQKLDDILRQAELYGLYLQLVFDFHGAYSSKVNPEWSNNPYNVINGGFLASPDQFFTHPLAKEIYKKRLRYIIARWGYSPHVMAWEFFNEVSFTDNFNERVINAWHQEMASFVKQLDPYKHLTTTSYGGDAIGDVYKSPMIDFSQYHIYAQNIFKQLPRISHKLSQFNKPHFVGEFGSDSANGRDDQDKSGMFLHAGLWSQFMQPASGNAMPWWWDTHIEPNHLYYHFAALAHFAKDIDRRQYHFTPVVQKLRMKVAEQTYDFDLVGLQSPEFSMFWLCDSLGMSMKGRPQHFAYEAVKIALLGFDDERYDLEFWDTYKGRILKKSRMESDSGRLAFELPRFSNDIAFKIRAYPKSPERLGAKERAAEFAIGK
jgi:hypothetical protein